MLLPTSLQLGDNQCCGPQGKSLSSRTNFQVLVLGHQVLVLVFEPWLLVLVLESQVLDNNTADNIFDLVTVPAAPLKNNCEYASVKFCQYAFILGNVEYVFGVIKVHKILFSYDICFSTTTGTLYC